MLVYLVTLEWALFTGALWLFLVGTVAGGVAAGLIFRGGLSELNRLAESGHLAATISTHFAAAYLGLGLVPVVTGLISEQAGAVDASAYTAGLVCVLVLVAIAVVRRSFGSAPAAAIEPYGRSWS